MRTLWRRQVVPRVVERALGTAQHEGLRARVCSGLTGDVLEVGFGSGRNVPHYPPAVRRVLAVEPSDVAWRLSEPRRRSAAAAVERTGLDGQAVPLPDASVDSALSTWTLCTVPDPVAALREVARVLRPGGVLHLVEHGAAPDAGVLRWQRRLDPVQRRLAGGCHLSRPVGRLLEAAGLHAVELEQRYARGEPRVVGSLYVGRAVVDPARGLPSERTPSA